MANSYLDLQGLQRFYNIISGRINQKLTMIAKTKAEWQNSDKITSQPNVLYVTTDYKSVTKDGTTYQIPSFKLGDGNAYVVDLPNATVDEETFLNHVNDRVVHITQAEREFWNNKNRAEIDENNPECLVMTIN